MESRKATLQDVPRIMEIISDAQKFLSKSGVNQWQDGYPTSAVFETDIKNGECYVFSVDGQIGGVITVKAEPDENYYDIEDGEWLTGNKPYVVFHRSAVHSNFRGKGIANAMLQFAEKFAIDNGYESVRADTHEINKPMRGLLHKRGYQHCGTIWLHRTKAPINHRVAYEKILTNEDLNGTL